jgi:hypothetical protein
MFVAAGEALKNRRVIYNFSCSDHFSYSQVASSDGSPSDILLLLEFMFWIGAISK